MAYSFNRSRTSLGPKYNSQQYHLSSQRQEWIVQGTEKVDHRIEILQMDSRAKWNPSVCLVENHHHHKMLVLNLVYHRVKELMHLESRQKVVDLIESPSLHNL